MFYAITINFNHNFHDSDIDIVVSNIVRETQATYVEVYNHAHDHYHALIDTQMILNKDNMPMTNMHYDVVRNLKAYQKYMKNHDVVDSAVWGEMGYYEKPNNDEIVTYVISHGLSKTVLKYGFTALRVYNQLKNFLVDYEREKK